MTHRAANLASGALTLRAPAVGKHRSVLIISAGICETPASTKVSPTNCVIPLGPGSGEMACGLTTLRACTNSAALVQATFAPGEVWSKPRADSLVNGIPASRLTSTLRVGTGTDRVRISEPLTPSFRVVSIRDVHNFSGRAIRFASNPHLRWLGDEMCPFRLAGVSIGAKASKTDCTEFPGI